MTLKAGMPVIHILLVISALSVEMAKGVSQNLTSEQRLSLSAAPANISGLHKLSGDLPENRSDTVSSKAATESEARKIYRRSVQPSKLPSVMTSPTSGYVTSPSCDVLVSISCGTDATFVVVLPLNHVTLVSFPVFDLKWSSYSAQEGFVHLTTWQENGQGTTIWKYKSSRKIVPDLYYTSVKIRLYVPRDDTLEDGFRMMFTLHPVSQTPPKLSEGVFNCSVPFYDSFKEHFDCNQAVECPGGRDEGSQCLFSSEDCGGNVAVGIKCYIHVKQEQRVTWIAAGEECERRGGNLATVKNPDEWDAFIHLIKSAHIVNPIFVGLRSFEPSMPSIYKNSYIWVDNTVNHRSGSVARLYSTFYINFCFIYDPDNIKLYKLFLDYFTQIPCELDLYKDFVCETRRRNTTMNSSSIRLPTMNVTDDILQESLQSLVKCPAGHVSHSFLLCDPNSQCGTEQYVADCSFSDRGRRGSVSMFRCGRTTETVPFTLVCDFRQDCADGSDETFCVHDEYCLGFLCRNGQCINKSKQCDVVKDCWDGSDELCTHYYNLYGMKYFYPPPSMLSFDSEKNRIQTNLRECASCPSSHFCCSEGYCVPLYCRCNGVNDCEGKEDEADCETYQCPGLYRCRSSRVCVHGDDLCNGWPQCPEQDDEWLCHARCPPGCLCQGHAFLCPTPFPLPAYPQLRYVDAASSGLHISDFTAHVYLVWLSLARCSVRGVSAVNLPNLRHLDLSYNQLSSLNMGGFLTFRNLQNLDLSSNPLVLVVSDLVGTKHKSLTSIDFSDSKMTVFNTSILSNFPEIKELNISYSTVKEISGKVYKSIPSLVLLDMRGSTISEYVPDVFKDLQNLRTIRADNYKLCCRDLLPQDFDQNQCFAPVDEISSCEDLLRSDTYRTFLWLFSVLSLAGNMGCVVARLFLLKNRSLTAFSIFVTNLSFADLLMGIYLALVGTADYIYRGKYFWFEKHWKPSPACQIAGFLSLLSSETSAFMICLITLDRFLVLSSPFSDFRFSRKIGGVACLLVWFVGFCFAAIPLLPVTREWEFYSQTGICVPLPITRRSFKGRNYAFAVIIVLNFVLFLLIATGQAMIYWTIRTTSMQPSSTRKTKDLTIARRLVSVAVSDFLCWFPIGLLGILSASGTPIPGEVNVGMAIFVLPLNAALNPFLYTFKALTERWSKIEEKQLLRQLEARSPALRGK